MNGFLVSKITFEIFYFNFLSSICKKSYKTIQVYLHFHIKGFQGYSGFLHFARPPISAQIANIAADSFTIAKCRTYFVRGFDRPFLRQTKLETPERNVEMKCIAWRPITSKNFIARAVHNILNLSTILYLLKHIYTFKSTLQSLPGV